VRELSGNSYDNTRRLDGIHWRHVKFVEQFSPDRRDGRWLIMSDVCKHCVQAECLEVCPTGAIIRTEFDTVVIQSDVCNGCRDCIAACPFGVIEINPASGTAQNEAGQMHWRLLRPLHTGVLSILIAVLGGLCGFFLAGYTGALLSVTNRPLWADTTWLGLLFLLSGTSTAAALLMLLGLLRGARTRETIYWLCRMDRGTLILELLALIILTVSLGPALRTWMNVWGLVLLVGVVLAGILIPLSLEWRPRLLGRLSLPAGAVLVLLGGFLLRVVVILSSEGV
jgi:NAD-dependent dihydropyrimidine dehydrogenase PreA subunit